MSVKSTLYIKNVLKSVSYAASDVFGDITPNFNEFKETNAEFSKATYAALKNPSSLFKKSVEAIQTSKVYQALDYGAKNLVEDLKTGNYYNKARKDQDELRLAGMDLSDWDDLSEFGVNDDWESKDTTTDDTITAGDKKIVDSIEGSNAAVASATVNAVINASNNQIKAGRADTSMLYAQNQALFGSIHKDITILGSTMDNIYKLQAASLENIDKNMTTFFTSETKLSAERNSILKEILELQRTVNKSAIDKEKQTKTAKSKSRIRWSDISIGGIPDIDSYFNAVKTNISKEIANMGVSGFSEDSNMLATFMVSPIAGAMTYVMKGLIPSTVKAAMSELDNTISGVFGNIIGEFGNRRGKDGLLGKLAKYLGVNTGVNRSIDPSKYEKGAIPFDGITRKAIIEVIPTHLRRIEAALTGNPEAIYDFKSGRWTNANDIKKVYKSIRTNAINNATSDIKADMQKGISSVKNGMSSKSDIESFEKAVEEFFEYLYENNGRFNPNVSAQKNGIDYKYPNLLKHYPKIKQIYNKMDYIEQRDSNGKVTKSRNYKLSTKMQLSNKVLSAKDSENASYRNIEEDPANILLNLFTGIKSDSHGSWKKDGKFKANNLFDLNNSKDNLGNTIFDYLQNINKELIYLNTYGGGFGGYPKSGRRYSKNTNSDKLRKERYNKISLNSKNTSGNWKNDIAEQQRLESESKKKIKSGEAIDIRDYDIDEEGYIDALGEKTSEGAAEAYSEILKSYGINPITARVDKIVGEDVKLNKNVKKSVEEAVESSDSNSDKKESFFKKWFNNFRSGQTFTSGLIAASAESFTNLLYTADRAIYDMMYKSEIINDDGDKTKYNGFLDAMVHKMGNKFKDIGKMFSEQIIDPFKEKLGIGDDFKNRFKSSMKNMGSKVWQSFKSANKSVYGPAYHEAMVALGLQQGESALAKRRKSNRKDILLNMKSLDSITDLFDGNLISMLNSFDMKTSDFDNVDDAKKALIKALQMKMYKESNNLKDKDINNDELQIIYDLIRSGQLDDNEISKIISMFGLKASGKNRNEINESIIKNINLIKNSANKNSRDERSSALLSSEKTKKYAAAHGFKGSIKEKKEMLTSLAKTLGVKVNLDSEAYDSDESLDKAFIRMVQHNNARGTIGKPFSGLTTLTKGEGLLNSTGFSRVPKTGVYSVTEPTHIINTEDMHSIVGGTRISVQQALGKEKLAAKAAGFKLKSNADGTLRINNEMKPEEVMAEAKKYIPEAAAGGLVGGVLSLVLGLAGGPIVGGALGAGASIIKNSDVLKDKLFGKTNDKGSRQGGIIPKKLLDKIHKYAPDMVKYGLAGIIPGLVTPLGLVGGILAGGAVGILSNNERFTNKYFGEGGKLQFNSKEKEIVSKLLPGALKGAGVGAVVGTLVGGPFGLLGNAALGSALGMMGTTEEFKESILGKEINGKRYGGVMGAIKDTFKPLTNAFQRIAEDAINIFDKNIVDPITRFIKPTIYALPKVLGFIPRKINDFLTKDRKLNSPFARILHDFVSAPIQKGIEKFLAPTAKTIMSAVTFPFRAVGKVGDSIRNKMINTHNAEDMTASERIKFKTSHGKTASDYDYWLQNIGTDKGPSVADAEKMSFVLSDMINRESTLVKDKNASRKEINNVLDHYGSSKGVKFKKRTKDDIANALENGNIKEVYKILHNSGLSPSDIKEFTEGEHGFNSMMKDYINLNSRISELKNLKDDDKNETVKAAKELFKKLGLDIDNKHDIEKFITNIGTETTDRRAKESSKSPLEKAEENREKIREDIERSTKAVIDIRDMIAAITSGDTDALKKISEKVNADITGSKNSEEINKQYENKAKYVKGLIGKETYDELDNETKENVLAGVHVNKDNEYNSNFARTVSKFGLTPDQIKATGGTEYKRIKKIYDRKGKLSDKSIKIINSLSITDFNTIFSYYKNRHVRKILSKIILEEEDISYMLTHSLRDVAMKCNVILSHYNHNTEFKSLKEVCDFYDNNDLQKNKIIKDKYTNPYNNKNEEATTVDSNGIGTMLLSGAGKVAKGLIKGVGAIGRGGKKLFSFLKNKKDNKEYENDIIGSTMGAGLLSNALTQSQIEGNSNLDETDKAGDGKDIQHVGGGKFITVERDSSGNVQPDTSDSNTKAVLNELSFKDKMLLKVQEAQLKAAEVIKANFDTSNIKESKGGKLGWLSMLLLGGLLWKSGILKKLYEGFIKPIWTDKIHPWIKNTAVPWITDVAIPKIGEVLGKVVGTAIKALPSLLIAALKGTGSLLDTVSGNKYNAGAVNNIDNNYMQQLGDSETEMYDENGNPLTGNDVLNHNYKKIYNADGTEGTVDKDGNVSFKDPSKKGMSYLHSIVNGGTHGLAKGLAIGRPGLLTRATSKVFSGVSHLGLPGKIIGATGKAFTAPVTAAEKLGSKMKGPLRQFTDKKIDDYVLKIAEKNNWSEDVLNKLMTGDGSKTSKTISKTADFFDNGGLVSRAEDKIVGGLKKVKSFFKSKADDVVQKATGKVAKTTTSETVEKAAKETAEAAVDKAVDKAVGEGLEKVVKPKNTGMLAKLLAKAKEVVSKLFSNSTVIDKLTKAAKALGQTKPAVWIKGLKSKLDDVLAKGFEKVFTKIGSETAKAVAGKVLFIVFLVKDFLSGCDRAESILGVKKTSIVEEVIAGIINAVCEFLIIPSLFNWTDNIASALFNFVDKDFKERQDEATKEYEEYIKESGSTETKQEYLEREHSLWGKTKYYAKKGWNGIKNAGGWAKDKVTSVFSNANGTIGIGTNTINPIGLLSPLTSIGNNLFYRTIDKSKSAIKEILDKTQNGKISILSKDYWKNKSINSKDNSLISSIMKATTNIIKLMNFPVFMIKNAMDTLSGNVVNMVSSVSGNDISTTSNTGNKSNMYAATFTEATKPKSFLGKVKSKIGGAFNKVKGFFGFGSNYNYGTGAYSKQIDPSIAGIRFNTGYDTEYQTIGNSGCGPAAAVNAIESMYGRGHEVLQAAKFALNHGYKETNGGTRPGFFTDYFNSKGYGSSTSYNKNQIERNINSGMPTVIMGKDPKGVSSRTPFGSSPHYVTVTGTDGKGNAIVQDPESRYDNQLYPVKNLIKNTSLGISAFGKRYGRGKWGKGKNTIIFIGDSRGEMMKGAVEGLMGKEEADKHIWAVKGAMGFEWMKSTGVPSIESKVNNNTAVVIMMGVNDLLNPDWYTRYADYINGKANDWTAKGADVYYVSVNPVGPGDGYTTKWGSITNDTVDAWNNNIKPKLSNKVRYMDLNNKLHDKFHTIDGVHYSWKVSKMIYEEIVKIVSGAEPLPSTSTNSSTSNNKSKTKSNTMLNMFSSVLHNSKIGRVMTSLIGIESQASNNNQSNNGSQSSNSNSSSSASNAGTFPKYALSNDQINGIANIVQHEQSGLDGMLAEASLMANLTDKDGDDKATVDNIIKKATSGWFAKGYDRYHNPGNVSKDAIKAVKAAIVNGKRTVPRYVDEHDCFSDLNSVTNNGENINKTNRSSYVQHTTKIKNKYGATYTFHSFPNSESDPFGYTSESLRTKWGENAYDPSTATSGLGKFGRGKWGRGIPEQIWWYLKKIGMTDEGAAGFMGNLEAESGLKPNNLENQCETKIGYNDETYTKAVDDGTISKDEFVRPMGHKYGYGLAQWTWPSRKEAFYNYMKDTKKVSIADLGGQLEWLEQELNTSFKGVFDVLKSSNSLAETSNKVLHDFEAPSNASAQESKRQSMGMKYLNSLKGTTGEAIDGSSPTNNGENGESENSNETPSMLSLFSDLIANSKAGKALGALLGITNNSNNSSNNNNSDLNNNAVGGDPAKVVAIAKQEVGTKETPVNEVKYNDWYWGHGGPDYPWCAAWVSWVADQAGIPTNIIPKDAYTVTAYQKLIKNGGKIDNKDAKPGDIIYFTKNQQPSGIYHTGIITENTGSTLKTVEGNSSDMVAERTYDVNSPKVLCARPQYANVGGSTTHTSSSGETHGGSGGTFDDAPDYSNTRGGNEYKPLSKFGRFNDSLYGKGTQEIKFRHRSKEGYSMISKSAVDDQLGKAMQSYTRKHVYSVPSVGKGTSTDYTRFITNIIDILITIADNTDKLNLIVSILNNKLNANITSNDISNATNNKQSLRSKLADTIKNNSSRFNNPTMDNSMSSIITAMNAIACE